MPSALTLPRDVNTEASPRGSGTSVYVLSTARTRPTNDYLAPAAAADYLGVSPKRIYDLKSMQAIEPDGYDGRTSLFRRSTLDAYVSSKLG